MTTAQAHTAELAETTHTAELADLPKRTYTPCWCRFQVK